MPVAQNKTVSNLKVKDKHFLNPYSLKETVQRHKLQGEQLFDSSKIRFSRFALLKRQLCFLFLLYAF